MELPASRDRDDAEGRALSEPDDIVINCNASDLQNASHYR